MIMFIYELIAEVFDMASTPMNTVIKFGKFVHVALYRLSKGRFANRIANSTFTYNKITYKLINLRKWQFF